MSDDEKKKITILIVDDIAENLQVLGGLLDKEGFDISPAMSGSEALRLVRNIKPDLILLDVMMPDMDGYEVCRQLKADEKTADIPVIFLTARVEKEDIVRGFQTGAVDYITKPFSGEELLSRVNNHLKIQRYQHEIERMNLKRKELLHVLCHDLANPLTAIMTAIQLIEPVNEVESEMVGYIEKSAKQGINIINVVRDIEAAETNEMQMNLQYVILNEALDSSLKMLQDKIETKGIRIVRTVPDDVVVYVELTTFINSVLNNLLTNAVKFSYKEGKIEIGIRAIPYGQPPDGNFLILEIKDYGIGIPSDIIESIFDPSKKTHRDGTEGEVGTGFGMPLVRMFVRAYGGDIFIESDTGQSNHGTTICLKLRRLYETLAKGSESGS
ncbi:MAG TPA: hybrid sensor histidine kinase/response regulator [Thermotogota bacterium]|nr:hybrid sensor histidine kinase/response regulator [Thermotogota bacterium]HPJ88400.1 hybrid sensor histidine kinase/response regulator [Thermotogota bacterium]